MSTLLTSSNVTQRSHRLAASYVQCACLLMLGSLAVLCKPAIAGTPSYPGPGASPAVQVAPPPVKAADPVGVPPGTGPTPPIVPPTPPKITPPLVSPPPPPLATPAPPPKPVAAAPTLDGGVTPGAGPKSLPVLAPPPKLDSAVAIPAASLTSVSAPAPAIAIDHTKTPTQGTGLNTTEITPSSVSGQSNAMAATPSALGASASLLPTSASSSADISEVLPGSQKLSESMREVPAVQSQAADKDAKAAVVNNKCIPVSFRPDSQRSGLSLVDLTGDGLIISAVPNSHIQTVLTNAGYGQVDLSQAARWCIAQIAVRALVRPMQNADAPQVAMLVQTGTSTQLMSKDQWLSYQASMTPVVTAMEPVIPTPTAVEPEVRTKPSKPGKLTKSSKPSNRMVTEMRKPAYL